MTDSQRIAGRLSPAMIACDVRYSVAGPADLEEVVALLAEAFPSRDALTSAVGITPAEYAGLVRPIATHALPDGLTIVARSAATGEMLGAFLSEDSASPPIELADVSPKFAPIFDIIAALEAEYRPSGPPPRGECLHLFLLGVAPAGAHRGIAQELVARTIENGRQRGYQTAATETTNRVSEHIFQKAGFTERVRRSYGDHRFEGRTPFAIIAGEGGPIIMDKSIA